MLTNYCNKIVIADTSCLLVFSQIGQFSLLKKLCPHLVTTPEVVLEYGADLPAWVEVLNVQNAALTKSINTLLGMGESSAIALALETPNSLILLDDKRARAYAKNLGLNYTGVIGLLRLGYRKGIIDDLDIIINELKANHFYLPDNTTDLIKN